ncbi:MULTISPECIES: tyrosine-type recombinase/integrase [unclassified Gammaproteobacteria]|uniref:tyrosine-type recombinase/integrase n=1 Tax=unclassified Gammaproteobacteria TaxID=33811 RepID=UPI001C8E7E42|nr:tyrosine-type recombinase/integrase [Bathymodiolus japonicus methanotrophic gill symbiont]
MLQADIKGAQATAKGLRHGFGVNASIKTRNPRLIQKWLGHTSIENTMIYMDAIGQEERETALKMWE